MLYGDTISALKDLLKSLLQRNLTPHGLQDMFAVGAGWPRWVLGGERGSRGACLPARGHEAEAALDPERESARLVLAPPCDGRASVSPVPLPPRLGVRHGCSGVAFALPGRGKVSRGGRPRFPLWARLLLPEEGGQHVVSGSGGTHTQPPQEAQTQRCPGDEAG